ncbi:MAG: efflux RND transporter periplasmic adaptor subunit [Alcanivorax sediminis]|uniref:Efflux RND transporter periplasmic adaptor subunit n=2 Tax=Alcanivorax sediminis TaxID=2663008 RepID=A0A6N7LPN8_9GAMM|nr:efflux RND transporter periplasmic adaptor subunit [Alcanivorax sediminis]MQX52178.1 efflux RND transporter periplasmic adaptor subunit [Alcanivorax sediminis]
MGRVITGAVVLLAIAAAAWWLLAPQETQRGQRPPTAVNLAPSIERDLVDQVEAVGTSRAAQAVVVLAEVPGRVAKIHFQQGQQVTRGALLVSLDDRNARAELARSEAEYQRAQDDFRRGQQLVEKRAISESEVDTFRTTLESARANRDAARANLNDHAIRAPFAGVVGLRQVDGGAYLQTGDAITTLDSQGHIEVDFQVPERYLARLAVGLPVLASNDAFAGTRFEGAISHLDSRVNSNSRTLTVRARLNNPGDRMLPGQFLRITVQLARRSALLVPEQAIITQGAQSYVFTVDNDNKAVRHPVTLGGRRDGWVEISSGLSGQPDVIVNGHSRLGSGQSVNVIDNPEALLPGQRALLEKNQADDQEESAAA